MQAANLAVLAGIEAGYPHPGFVAGGMLSIRVT
jgi:hypothetical protein